MNPTEQKLDQIFHLWQQGLCPGGQVLVSHRGKVIYDKCFGYANLEHQVPITQDTVFHVASVSKQITVLCALLLWEEGKLDIQADIRQYVGDLVAFSEPVTVYQLMHNISGIRDQWELLMMQGVRIDDTITMEDLKRAIAKQRALNFAPGSEYLYSNSNFTLLAEMVERITGETLHQFAKRRIFDPLGMGHTCIKEHFSQIIPGRAYSYDDNGEGGFCYHPINFAAYGATSLHTTAHDMMRVLENYGAPKVGKPETIEAMMERPILADGSQSIYGGGLMLGEYKGQPYLEHGGVDAGYRAHVMRLPKEDLNIVILCNTQNTIPALAARRIADVVLDLPEQPAEHEAYRREEVDAAQAAGLYLADLPWAALVRVEMGKSGLTLGAGPGAPALLPLGGNCYQVGYLPDRLYLGRQPAAYQMGANLMELRKLDTGLESTERLLDYEGTYGSAELDTHYHILEEEGALYAVHARYGRCRLYACGTDRYVVQMEHLTVILTFLRGSGNQVIGFAMDGGRVRHMGFTKLGG